MNRHEQGSLVGVLLAYLVFLLLVVAVAERAPRLRSATYVLAISV